jgi:hypothetical protein
VSTKRLDQTAKVPSRKKDGNAPLEDVRHERTGKRLAGAVLSLASKRDIGSASVSELSLVRASTAQPFTLTRTRWWNY